MKENHEQPARPCMPLQDTMGRLVAPFPGFTKYEEVLLRILCAKEQNGMYDSLSNETLFRDSMTLTDLFFEKTKKQENEPGSASIINI